MKRYSWTQPQCTDCWVRFNPDRLPVRVKGAHHEQCVSCGEDTVAGVYVRIDPTTALFPSIKKSA